MILTFTSFFTLHYFLVAVESHGFIQWCHSYDGKFPPRSVSERVDRQVHSYSKGFLLVPVLCILPRSCPPVLPRLQEKRKKKAVLNSSLSHTKNPHEMYSSRSLIVKQHPAASSHQQPSAIHSTAKMPNTYDSLRSQFPSSSALVFARW